MLAPQKLLLLSHYSCNRNTCMIWKKVCFKSSQGIAFSTQKPHEKMYVLIYNKRLDISEGTVKTEAQSLELIFSVLQFSLGFSMVYCNDAFSSSLIQMTSTMDAGWVHLSTDILFYIHSVYAYCVPGTVLIHKTVSETQILAPKESDHHLHQNGWKT